MRKKRKSQFKALENKLVVVGKSNIPNTDMLGLFSKEDFTCLEYETGDILTRFEFEEEAKDMNALAKEKRYSLKMPDGRIFYLMSYPTCVEKLGFYSNEARGKAKPNCYLTAMYRRGIPFAQLRVLDNVEEGQELLYHYGDEFHDHEEE